MNTSDAHAGDTFIILLTFGNVSDWSRNLRAAFTPVDRAAFRVLGIRQYLLLHRADD